LWIVQDFPLKNADRYSVNAERQLGNADRILALQNWHFSNANQHLIIENQYFSNAVFLSYDTQEDLDHVVFDRTDFSVLFFKAYCIICVKCI
jgi:hypothetical protein